MIANFVNRLNRIGPIRFTILLILLPASLLYLVAGLYVVSGFDPLDILQEKPSSGDDFVTF